MLPFKLTPVFQDYIWGGGRLKTEYGKKTAAAVVAESWELSAYPGASAVIATGELAGTGFYDFVFRYPQYCGNNASLENGFPILMKLIDAKRDLSIHVHPDNDYALREERESGKTEMWVVLDCEPGSFLYFGFKQSLSREEVNDHLKAGRLEETLRRVEPRKGDVFYIPAGTLHGVGGGLLLVEIQQNSNLSYRLYDYNRSGPGGKPRPLQVEKALDVLTAAPAPLAAPGACSLTANSEYELSRLVKCDLFTVFRLVLSGRYIHRMDPSSFMAILCVEGDGTLICGDVGLPVTKGETIFVPATREKFELSGIGGFIFATI